MGHQATYNKIIESKLLLEIGSVFKKYSRKKLRFYEEGLVIFPVKYFGGIALSNTALGIWEDIKGYRFERVKGLYKTANKGFFENIHDESLKYSLHIETNKILSGSVNNLGMSVFGLMGFFINEHQVENIKIIFNDHGIKELQVS